MSEHKIIIGDCREELENIEKESIKLAITSPPYNLGKDYGHYVDDVSLQDWKHLVGTTLDRVYDVLTDDGSFFLNVSPIPSKKTKEIIPLDSIAWGLAKKEGFALRNKIIWRFHNMQNCTIRLSGRWEAILWLVKDIDNYTFNLDDVKVPCLTKNDKRFDPNDGRNPTDVWYFDRVNNMRKKKLGIDHPCVYPLDMIERIIKMSSNEGDWVLDPFAGSGTTLVAAKKLNRNAIGIELNPDYKDLIIKRLTNEVGLLNFH